MVSVGDVTNHVSKAQITFDVPQSANNSIVIYGVEAFNMRAVYYNGLQGIPSLSVKLKSKNGVPHEVIFASILLPGTVFCKLTHFWQFYIIPVFPRQ